MTVLFECNQCSHQEWRSEDQEPWLCLVCGNMRWSVVATEESQDGGEPRGRQGADRGA